MGLSPFKGNKCTNTNPNPERFKILTVYYVCRYYTALRVRYPDCINAEGVKILVMRENFQSCLDRKRLDPHFGPNDAPIARFEPTDFGWWLAKELVDKLSESAQRERSNAVP